jgi:transcription initiation factor IIF auxiliary subunit
MDQANAFLEEQMVDTEDFLRNQGGVNATLSTVNEAEALRIRQIKRIIEYQFDLEILYKRQELDFIANELERGKRILSELKQLVYYDTLIQNEQALQTAEGRFSFVNSDPFVAAAASLQQQGTGTQITELGHPPSQSLQLESPASSRSADLHLMLINRLISPNAGQSGSSRKMEHKHQYEMKKDGTFVKLVCPVCGKDKFGNVLGLTNHCRILHDIRFSTPEERIEKCGMPVSMDEIPRDYFVENERILHSELNLAQIRSQGESTLLSRSGARSSMEQTSASHPGITSLDHYNPLDNRFYIRKKIIIGNMSLRVAKGEVAPDGNVYTHQWKLFVCGPPEDVFSVETFIKKVRFYLHTSYHPEDIVDVTKPPFAITRYGWGEFPVRVQLHFWDRRNPPKDFIHELSFRRATYKEFHKSSEVEHWVDLDKSTIFKPHAAHDTLVSMPKSTSSTPNASQLVSENMSNQRSNQTAQDHDAESSSACSFNGDSFNPDSDSGSNLASPGLLSTLPSSYILTSPHLIRENLSSYLNRLSHEGNGLPLSGLDLSKIDSVLVHLFPYFPLFRSSDKPLAKVNYRLSKSMAELLSWKTHRRMSVEWHRAYMMKRAVCQLLKLESLHVIPTKYVLLWCRDHDERAVISFNQDNESDNLVKLQSTMKLLAEQESRDSEPTKREDSDLEKSESKEHTGDAYLQKSDSAVQLPANGNTEPIQHPYCRFCGRQTPIQVYASHLKRCALKPYNQDPMTLISPPNLQSPTSDSIPIVIEKLEENVSESQPSPPTPTSSPPSEPADSVVGTMIKSSYIDHQLHASNSQNTLFVSEPGKYDLMISL